MEDITEGIIIPPFLKAGAHSGDLWVIFQGLGDPATEPESS